MSKHKHSNKKCLVYVLETSEYMLCEYCEVCKRIKYLAHILNDDKTRMSNKDIIKKYKGLPVRSLTRRDSKYMK